MEKTEAERLTRVEERSKSNTKRLDGLEVNYELIRSMAESMAKLAVKQDHIDEKVGELGKKIDCQEKVPKDRWNGLVNTFLALLAGVLFSQFIK